MSDRAQLLAAYRWVRERLPAPAAVLPLALRRVGAEGVSSWAAHGWAELVRGANRYEWELAVAVERGDDEGAMAAWLDTGLALETPAPAPEATAAPPAFVAVGWRTRPLAPDATPWAWRGAAFSPGWVLTLAILVPILYEEPAKRITLIRVDVRDPREATAGLPADPPAECGPTVAELTAGTIHTRTPTEPRPDWNDGWDESGATRTTPE